MEYLASFNLTSLIMKQLIILLSNKITIGLFLSMIFSCIFAVVFRFLWLSYGVQSVDYILSYEYISYIAIIALFKFIFGVLAYKS